MQRHSWLALLGFLVAAVPAWSQDREPRRPPPSGEIQIPSQSTLEREAVTIPRDQFSPNDATATKQMDQQDKQIDRKVMKGICADC
jgi:hypothetical protein